MNPYSQVIIVASLFIAITGCKKANSGPVTHIKPSHDAYGTVTVNRNGHPWPMRGYAVRNIGSPISSDSAFLLVLNRYADVDGDSIVRDVFNIGNIKYKEYYADIEYAINSHVPGLSVANLTEYGFYTQHSDDGDAVSFSSGLLLSEPHFIRITSYNPVTKEISGQFSASFLSQSATDTVRWTDGAFSTKIFPE